MSTSAFFGDAQYADISEKKMTGEAGCSAALALAEWVDVCKRGRHYTL